MSKDAGVQHLRINVKVKVENELEETPALTLGGAEWKLGFEMANLTMKIYIKYFQKERYKWLNNKFTLTLLESMKI
uniref:Uncharacterized protein n=1 Tax=Ditylenchus dipsaci TaxID=166011 RepID=A0A915EFC0_9BILA